MRSQKAQHSTSDAANFYCQQSAFYNQDLELTNGRLANWGRFSIQFNDNNYKTNVSQMLTKLCKKDITCLDLSAEQTQKYSYHRAG